MASKTRHEFKHAFHRSSYKGIKKAATIKKPLSKVCL
jgi:hypothetical protein